ncbi:winged helix-turn-helix transcriptional regulator [Nocardia sp. NBC_01388]|uniref:winged helix-turn-helix transcriptional regulator n=1 Tax=Nocardia sp. NBC_01388 TaxID=2903596 RepID=UPI00324DDE63
MRTTRPRRPARIANKWVSVLINALADGPQRYGDLSRRVAGISQKMLTHTLRAMERDGLVERTITAAVPVRVDYEPTELGASLLPVMRTIKGWAETPMDQVLTAREDYDAER